MKYTRLEAIKAWGRASREGKPIPEEVREVLINTQNDGLCEFHAQAPLNKSIVNKRQVVRHINDKKTLTASNAIRSVGSALNPKQMEIYNQKRKLDNQNRKNDPQLYSNSMHELLESGLSIKQATKQKKDIIQREKLERFNKEKRTPAAKATHSTKFRAVVNERKIKFDPWLIKKNEQDEINKAKNVQRKIEVALIRRPISCIECKIDFKYFGEFVEHTRYVHKTSISTPKLIVRIDIPVTDPDIEIESTVLSYNETEVENISNSIVKNPESFSDKWIRLFSENGYTTAMVDAFKREATKQGMDVKQLYEFLDVCKPSIKLIETTIRVPKAIVSPVQSNAVIKAAERFLEAPVGSIANDPSYGSALSESVEQALFADRIVRIRTNQSDFKERVAANFGYRCAITNSGEALEAAHIEPVGTGNNNTSNGVLMLACLHRLFDAGLMAINPDFLTIHFKTDCTYFAKSALEGKKINDHPINLNKSGLLERWLKFDI